MTETKRRWRKVHWRYEEYPWGVLEGPDTPQHRDESFGPFMDERIVAHCYHEADVDHVLALEARVEELEAALREIMLGTDDNGLGDSYSWEDCNRIARRVLDDA